MYNKLNLPYTLRDPIRKVPAFLFKWPESRTVHIGKKKTQEIKVAATIIISSSIIRAIVNREG